MNYSKKQIHDNIVNYIQQNFFFAQNNNQISDDASLVGIGIIDSTGILEIINHVQSEFAIEILDEEMLPENLDSISNIVKFIAKKLTK